MRNKARVSTLPTLTWHSTGLPNQRNKIGERNKWNSNRKERSQIVTICRWYDLIPERPKNSNKNLIDFIKTFHKVTGYKPVVFLYTNNEQSEKEIRNPIRKTVISQDF
jgi:GH25 family lysozyme M1 (1,4-beta-N-acetylmuramidase)